MLHHAPIAVIGNVNLLTGKNAMFDTVWNCWGEDATEYNMLYRIDDDLIIIHTAGQGDAVGTVQSFQHDQSMRPIKDGRKWTCIAMTPHTKAGLAELAGITGKKTIRMATYK